jgi:hypothetical protein
MSFFVAQFTDMEVVTISPSPTDSFISIPAQFISFFNRLFIQGIGRPATSDASQFGSTEVHGLQVTKLAEVGKEQVMSFGDSLSDGSIKCNDS